MKIVVLDGYTINPGDLSWERLEMLGETIIYDRTDERDVAERINDGEIVFTNKVRIGREVMEACPNLKFIQVTATGYDIIDKRAADERGIVVCNVPSYGTEAVGQYAIGLLLEVCHHIGEHNHSVKAGDWSKSKDWCYWNYPLIELTGKTAGILGFGRIGQATGRIASALGMKVLACDKTETKEGRKIGTYVDWETLLSQSDVIFLHCPLTENTREIIREETIKKMKDGVILINNSRGGLIREKDLADQLKSGKVGAAALDVVSKEPISGDNVLLTAPNCIITPHISWAAKESRERLLNIGIDNLEAYLDGEPKNVV